MSTKTDFNTFNRAKQSVSGRLKRLRIIRESYRGFMGRGGLDAKKSPIAEIGCFEPEIDAMEKTLKNMQSRLDHATVKIPD